MGKFTMRILRFCSRFAPQKEMDPADYLERARKRNHPFHRLKDRRAFYTYFTVSDCPVILIRSKKAPQPRNKAILYLHGGITNEWEWEIMVARGYADRTGMDVWYPVFPSVTQASADDIVETIYAVYRNVVAMYGAANTALIGTSFGGTFGFGLICRINMGNASGGRSRVSLPALYIANSPGGIPETEEDWEEMERMSAYDPLISVSMVREIIPLQELLGGNAEQYANSPAYGDLSAAPKTYVYYAEETLAGNHKAYERAYRKYGNELHLHIQPGMMHGYSCLPVFRESKEAYFEQIAQLKKV